jgi:hypothetical protein
MGPLQMVDLWEHKASSKAVWKSFTLPEMGQLLRSTIKNGRAQSRSMLSYKCDSDSVSGDCTSKIFGALQQDVNSLEAPRTK